MSNEAEGVRAGWYASPSGHPTYAATAATAETLAARGYVPCDEPTPEHGRPGVTVGAFGSTDPVDLKVEHTTLGPVDQDANEAAVVDEGTGPDATKVRQKRRKE